MNTCHYFKPRLALWAGGDLNPSEAAALQSHLAICPACGDRLQQLQQARIALEHSDPEPTYLEHPRSLWPEVNRRITAALAVPHVPVYRRKRVWQATAACLLVVVTWLAWPRGSVGPGKPDPRGAVLPAPIDIPEQSVNAQSQSQSSRP